MHIQLKHSLFVACLSLTAPALGQISFTGAPAVPTGQEVDGHTFADLNGDGIADLAAVSEGFGNQDLLELFMGAGDGTFLPAGTTFLPSGSSPDSIATSDVDGDGDLDLAVTLDDFNQVVIALNQGGFQLVLQPGVNTGGAEPRSIAAWDMDGDGDEDFVVGHRDSNSVSVLLNQGGALALAGVFPAGQEPRDVAVGDWNGDGLGDVAAAAQDSRQIVVLLGQGGGLLGAAQNLSVPGGARPSGLTAADMDGDGDLDLVAGNGDDTFAGLNFVSVYTNTAGVFSAPLNFPAGGLDAGDVIAADFDLDGIMDVVVTHESGATIGALRGTGGGALGAAATFVVGAQPSTIAGADLDGNGSIDLGVAGRQLPNINILLNDASAGGGVTNYCTAVANSSGAPAMMSAAGSTSLLANDLVVTSSSMPANTLGYFLTSQTQGFVPLPPGSSGNLCLGGAIGRYATTVLSSGATGEISLAIDFGQMPSPTGFVAAVAGETWNFQSWFRDSALGSATSNFSDGLAVTVN